MATAHSATVSALPAVPSPWSPLRQPLFRALWIASVVSNVGTWMQNVGAAWLMTSLAPSPAMVALVQAATALPLFLLALPAGALADVVDRRRLLLATQVGMAVAAAALGALTLAEAIGPWALLAFTFVLGVGAALSMPAWQAIMPDLVPRSQLAAVVALNGISLNVALALGAALGGAVITAVGPAAAFLVNAASFLGIVVVLYRWQPPPRESLLPAEHVLGAMRTGLRYVRHSPGLRRALVRTAVFIVCGSALWALLPALAREELGLGSLGYGILFACLGAGAVVGAALLPGLRPRLGIEGLAAGATVVFAVAALALASVRELAVLGLAMVAAGAAMMALMATLNTTVQSVSPAWVRARTLAVWLLVFSAGMTGGSALWGAVAARFGIPAALLGTAVALLASLLVTARYRLPTGEQLDLTPSLHWPEPVVVGEVTPDRGPVLVLVEYRVDPAQAEEFTRAMRARRRERLRDGAMRWGLWGDPADPGRYLESFVVESWAEHLRQHERVTVTDRAAEERALAYHVGDAPPAVSHFIAERLPG